MTRLLTVTIYHSYPLMLNSYPKGVPLVLTVRGDVLGPGVGIERAHFVDLSLSMAVRVQGEQLHAATINVHSHDIYSYRHLSISYASLFRWRKHDNEPSDLCTYSKKKYWCVHMCTKSNTDMMPPRLCFPERGKKGLFSCTDERFASDTRMRFFYVFFYSIY